MQGDRRVIRFNLRGHAENKEDSTEFSIQLLSEDLFGLLQFLNVEKAVLIGHSMGGMISKQFALNYPEMVEQLIIVASVSRMLFSPGRKLLVALSRLVPFRLFVRLNITRAFRRGFPKEELEKHIANSQRVSRHVVMSCYDAMCQWDVSERLPSLSVKTLVIHSKYDTQFPLSEGKKIAQRIPGAVLKVTDCGHEIPLEKPAELSAAIQEVL